MTSSVKAVVVLVLRTKQSFVKAMDYPLFLKKYKRFIWLYIHSFIQRFVNKVVSCLCTLIKDGITELFVSCSH